MSAALDSMPMSQPTGMPPLPPAGPADAVGRTIHPVSIDRIFGLTVSLLRFGWRPIFGAAAIIMLPVVAATTLVTAILSPSVNAWLRQAEAAFTAGQLPPAIPADVLPAAGALFVCGLALSFIGLAAAGAVVNAIGAVYAGAPVTVRSAATRGIRRLPLLAAASILYLLVIVGIFGVGTIGALLVTGPGLRSLIGLFILVGAIAAGVFVFVRWSFVQQSVVLEGKGAVEALGLSWRLVAGSTWRVLGYTLLLGLVVGAIGLAFGFVSAAIGGSNPPTDPGAIAAQSLVNGLAGIIVGPLSLVPLTLLYYDLSWRRAMQLSAADSTAVRLG